MGTPGGPVKPAGADAMRGGSTGDLLDMPGRMAPAAARRLHWRSRPRRPPAAQPAVAPPSIESTWPVIHAASSERRWRIQRATSSAVPSLRIG